MHTYKESLIREGLSYYFAIPQHLLWMLVVDGKFWAKENGYQGYEERENGSIYRAIAALKYAIRNIDQDLFTLPYFNEINRQLMLHPVDPTPSDEKFSSFGLHRSTTTRAGFRQLLDGVADGKLRISLQPHFFAALRSSDIATSSKEMKFKMVTTRMASTLKILTGDISLKDTQEESDETIIDKSNLKKYSAKLTHFYSLSAPKDIPHIRVAGAQPIMEKIKLVINSFHDFDFSTTDQTRIIYHLAKHCQQMLQVHPYPDYNLRTYITVLLNALLMKQGMPPVIYHDPNQFDGHSIDEIAKKMYEGMNNTLRVINGCQELFGFAIPPSPFIEPSAKAVSI